ncbi:MAG: leucyl aminopeptidase family protein, partial [Caulobacteraceae bacterium]
MSDALLDAANAAVPIQALTEASLAAALQALGGQAAGLAEAEGFKAKAGQVLKLPDADGKLCRILLGLGGRADALRTAAGRLPAGDYRLEAAPEGLDPTDAAVAWGLGAYRYDRYKPAKEGPARLVLPDGARGAEARAVV